MYLPSSVLRPDLWFILKLDSIRYNMIKMPLFQGIVTGCLVNKSNSLQTKKSQKVRGTGHKVSARLEGKSKPYQQIW